MAFEWDASLSRYRDNGRLVPDATIRAALDTVLSAQAGHARDLTQQLIDGNLSLAGWQTQMQDALRSAHLVGTSLANGGWANLGPSEFGWTGQRIQVQRKYLAGFAQQIANGDQPLDGTALSRAEMYMEAARATHRAALSRLARDNGMEQERSQLGGSRESCGQCITEAMRGWVGFGELIPVGSRTCLSRCHCSISYRLAPVGAEAA